MFDTHLVLSSSAEKFVLCSFFNVVESNPKYLPQCDAWSRTLLNNDRCHSTVQPSTCGVRSIFWRGAQEQKDERVGPDADRLKRCQRTDPDLFKERDEE